MRKKIITALIVAVTAFSMTACQGVPTRDARVNSLLPDSTTSESEEDSQEDSPGVELDEETARLLYNTYINIYNAMIDRVYDSLDRYFSYVDYDSEEFRLLDEDGDYYDCYSVSRVQREVETAYGIASSKGEKDTLDQAFLDMYPSLNTLIQTLNEISEYTDPKTFLEDGYAKSQEHHTALISVLDEYYTTGEIFMAELSVIAEQQRMEDLEQMKADGYVVFYSVNMMIDCAQKLENELYSQGVWDDNILDMDLTAIQPLYDEFSTYVDAILAYDDDKEALQAEGLNNSGYWITLVMNMKNTRESISKVLAKVEAGEPLDQFDTMISSIAGQCSLSSFEEGVSDMIDSYNRLIAY